MSEGRSWEGNWKVRLYERVRERGYDSLTAFAEARPTASLLTLAEELGPDDLAGVQVFSGLLAEALPSGWPAVLDDESRVNVAIALARWGTFTPETHEQRVERAKAALRASPPPAGWRPLGPDDELLLTLLPDEEA